MQGSMKAKVRKCLLVDYYLSLQKNVNHDVYPILPWFTECMEKDGGELIICLSSSWVSRL